MFDAAPQRSVNLLLASLTASQRELLVPHLQPVELPQGMQVEAPGEPIAHAYFPSSGLASVIAQDRAGLRIEAGLFGRDGMTALSVVMGDDRSPHETTFQIAGIGHRIKVEALRQAMRTDPAIRDRFLLFAQAFAIQAAQTALANGRHRIEARLARWLLMCQDRLQGNELPLTHEFLSVMLGVRRAGVTVAIHMLEGRHLVRGKRGCLCVLDRQGLEAVASGSNGVTEAEYTRLMGVSLGAAEQPVTEAREAAE